MAKNNPKDPKKAPKDVRKEMDMLIKLEAATTPGGGKRSGGGRGHLPSGEEATRPGGRGRGPKSPKDLLGRQGEEATWVNQQAPGTDVLQDVELEDDASLMQAMTEKVGLPYGKIEDYSLDTADAERLRGYIPADLARERRMFPLKEEPAQGGASPTLIVGIADPLDITLVDDLRLLLPEHDIDAIVIEEQDIIDAIDKYYGIGDESMDTVIEEMNEQMGAEASVSDPTAKGIEIDLEQLANDPPVIKLVNLMLVRSVQERASDLHIEPFAGSIRMRYRVDGVLREIPSPPKRLQMGLVSRLKVMAGMNISESRRPQDGRIRLSISGKEIDLRVASVPTVHGESIVMRVLDKSTMMVGIRQLGFQKEVLSVLLGEAKKPNGIVLVTGPTGCGKTTTLYSVLTEVFDSGLKFITTEDPVEYELPGIVQVNINARVGLTFAACLRSILRQDPDVILVGEIRDVETAQISIQAALTGHMVFSTLHTNSASATITRLVDMGIEPFLLTSTLRCVVGQRLIRTICPSCKEPYIPTDEELEEFAVNREEVEDITFYHGRGCDDCNFTGYKGRLGIFETLRVTEEINELILQRSTSDEIHALAIHQGMQTMRGDGWLKICLGATTFDEVSKQTPRETEESARQEMASAQRSLKRIETARAKREAEDNADFVFDEGAEEFGLPEFVEGDRNQENEGGGGQLQPG